jgi:hypothetical protein
MSMRNSFKISSFFLVPLIESCDKIQGLNEMKRIDNPEQPENHSTGYYVNLEGL